MAFINRYSDTIRGALTFTGNTAGLSKLTDLNQAGTIASIGAFTSLNTGLQVPTFPAGTTLNIAQNGSAANLVIPAGSTVVYAELIWGGNYYGQNPIDGTVADISGQINNPVNFTTTSSNSITPDPATAQTQTATITVAGAPFPLIFSFYERSQNVTSLVQALGAGTHTISVQQIPGLTAPIDNQTGGTNHAGWTLAVAYTNPALPYRSLNIWVGAQIVDRVVTPIVDIPVSGFHTPATGTVTGRLLLSAQEGDATGTGDQALFGPNVGSLTVLSGPNNPATNFFASQINNDSGNIDTTGTFGNRNQDAFAGTNISAGRQGWDITNVDVSAELANNQTNAVIRLTTVAATGNTGESYMPNTIGLQIDSEAPIITMTKASSRTAIVLGETIQYTLTITNTGTSETDNFLITDVAPLGTTINIGSINVSGATGPVVNTSTPLALNIEVGSILPNQVVTVTYTVNTTAATPVPILNTADGTYTFTPVLGNPPIAGTSVSNEARTDAVLINKSKSSSNTEALVGDTVTYTVTIDNSTGTAPLSNVFVLDNLQLNTSYVANSTVIGANPPINSDPSIAPGISVGTVAAGTIQTVKFNVKIDSLTPQIVNNTANVTYTVGGTNYTEATNQTTLDILNPDITIAKSVDKTIAQVGNHLVYTTVITNTGDTPISNLIFSDAPPANTAYDGNGVTINAVNYPALNPNNNISLVAVPVIPNPFPLQPNQSVTISYGVNITSAPVSNQIDNTANATAEFLVNGTQRTLTDISNVATTTLFALTIVKAANKTVVQPGDTITYTSTITSSNPGTYANDIIFIDAAPAGTTIVVPSINVSGATIVTNNSTTSTVNLNLGPTFPNNPIVVTFDVLVGASTTGPILNISSVDIGTVTTDSNQVTTSVVNPGVSKSSSVNFADIGTIYTYNITIDNTGNPLPLTNVFVYDPLQGDTSYVPNTTIIGANPPINSNPSILPGVNVGTVPANSTLIVSFDVVVNNIPTPNPILNTATVNYVIDGVAKTKDTNQTSVQVNNADLIGLNGANFVKSRDLAFANVGDEITYTLSITNTGNVTANNVVITDPVPGGTTYVAGSLTGSVPVTGSPVTTIAVTNGIAPGQTITVSYKVLVTQVPTVNPIPNTASLAYAYTVDPANPNGATDTGTSNTVTTQVNNADLIGVNGANFVKSRDLAFANVGDEITYTLSITNTGNVTANNVVITDPVPAGTSYVSGSLTGSVAVTGDPTTTINVTNGIAPGQTITVSYKVLVTQVPTVNPIPNTASLAYAYTVDPANPNGVTDTGTSNTVTTQVNNADLIGVNGANFLKSRDVAFANVGDEITYTLSITNTGNVIANNVVITDPIPNGTSYVPGSITGSVAVTGDPTTTINVTNGIAPGQTITISYKVLVTQIPTVNPIPNTASLTYVYTVDPTNPNGATGSGTSNTVTTGVNNADLLGPNFLKSRDLVFANVGDEITYTLSITNTGNVVANNVVITDPIPSGTTYVAGSLIGSVAVTGDPTTTINVTNGIAPGQTITISYKVLVTQVPTVNPIPNTANVAYTYTSDPANPNGESANGPSNTVTTQVNNADLIGVNGANFVKSRDLAFANIGDEITYTLSITNTGNVTANNVVITDPVPAGTSYVAGSLTGSVAVTGSPLTTISVTNGIAPGQTITVSYKVLVTQVPTVNPIPNTASLAYAYTVNPANPNGATDTGTSNTVTTQVNNADLIGVNGANFVKSRDLAFANVGDEITYTLSITNTGNVTANNVVITDPVPVGTSYVPGSLTGSVAVTGSPLTTIAVTNGIAAGQTITVSYKVLVTQIPTVNPIPNTASLAYAYTVDPASPNGATDTGTSNTVTTQVNNADLIGVNGANFVKSRDLAFANVGDEITYTLSITNTGNVTANNVVITDPVPAGTSYVAGSLIGSVAVTGSPLTTISVTNGIAAGQTITVSYKVLVTQIPTVNPIPNTASLAYAYTVDPANPNGATDTGTSNTVTTQVNNADLIGVNGANFVKSRDLAFANVGDEITYTLSITNTGNVTANNVVITDPVPGGTSYVAGSLTGNVPVTGSPVTTIVVTNGIGAGQTITVSYKVLVTQIPTINPIPNTASLAYTYTSNPASPNGESGSGSSNTVTTQVNAADLIGVNGANFVKSRDLAFADVGDEITYTLSITNTGNVIANNVVITDPVPAGTSYVVGSLTGSVPVTGSPLTTIAITNGVAPAQTITVSYKVLVTQIPTVNPIPNTASLAYTYTSDPASPNGESANGTSNTVTTQVNNADLIGVNGANFVKSRDLAFADVGSTITYTLSITNTGNVIANNVVITDPVPSGTSYVVGSLTGSVAVTGSPLTTIAVTNGIAPGQTITVTYKVLVTQVPTVNPIPNTASLAYAYTVDPANPNGVTDTGTSNTVTTEVNNADLIGVNGANFVKSRDLAFADVGDEITYTLSITNTGNVIANNVVITDPIPSGTSYVVGSLTGSVQVAGSPLTTINIVNGVAPGQTVTVSYKVLVTQVPTVNPIPNTASLAYAYTVNPANPNGKSDTGTSNTVTTQINNADLIGVNGANFVKSRDLAFADIGDEITYTLSITNTGNVIANNVVITDPVPVGTSYVAGSLTGSVPVTGSPVTTIAVTNGIAPGQTITVSYKVLVTQVPAVNPIPNTASVSYVYTVNPANPNGATDAGTSNTVTTQVNNADLIGVNGANFVKSRDLAFADIGDEITYTLSITNTGNVIANNVIITDPIPGGTSYVVGSLIGSVALTGSPVTTIAIPSGIAPGQTVLISYKVVVNVIPTVNPIPNTASVSYAYTVDPARPNGATDTGSSNTVTTQVNHGEILPDNAVKSADKSVTTPGDIVTYTISAKNTGNVPVNNVMVKDVIPVGTEFVAGTVVINGVAKPSESPILGINIGTIAVGSTGVVTFKVKVLETAVNPTTNDATVDYSYIVDPAKPPVTETLTTNEVDLTVLKSSLKLVKSADRVGAVVGDIIRYTIIATNDGEIPLNNVNVKDSLNSSLQFVGNLTVNGVVTNQSIISGVNIGSLAIGESKTVSFDAKVTAVPLDKNSRNKATATFSYIVSGNTFNRVSESNEVAVRIYTPKLEMTKTPSLAAVKVGETFTYNIAVRNAGDIVINNVIVKDILPAAFKVLDIKVDGISVNGNIASGVNIGTINIGLTKTVVLTIEVLSDLVDSFKNIVTGEGTATTDPNKPVAIVTASATDSTGVQVFNPELTLTKSVDKAYAVVGEIVTYTVVAKNTGDIILGNVELDPVAIYDLLSPSLSFIDGSVTIDGASEPTESIISGVNIGELNIGESKTITFKVKVVSAVDSPIENNVQSTFGYKLPGRTPETGISTSNVARVIPEVSNIDIVKTANKSFVVIGDTIEYTVVLKNTGTLDALNVIFKDELPTEVTLIEGSFLVNGTIVNSVDLAQGVSIGNIGKGSEVIIKYSAKINGTNCELKIINKSSVTFNYILPNGSVGATEIEGTSTSSIVVDEGISNFKQLKVEEELIIPKQKPDIEEVLDVTGEIEILKSYIIKTPVGTSNEGQSLTGYKLFVHAVIKEVVEYTALDAEQSVHSAHYKIPFTTFVVLPEGYCLGSKVDINADVEHIYFKELDERGIFSNATVIIKATLCNC